MTTERCFAPASASYSDTTETGSRHACIPNQPKRFQTAAWQRVEEAPKLQQAQRDALIDSTARRRFVLVDNVLLEPTTLGNLETLLLSPLADRAVLVSARTTGGGG